MRSLILLLALSLVALAAPTAVADTSHHYGCGSDPAGCVVACADHLLHHVAHEGSLPGIPPCLVHP